jgi:hypothetical protein
MNWQLLAISVCSASAIFSVVVVAALRISGRISRAEEMVDRSGDRM